MTAVKAGDTIRKGDNNDLETRIAALEAVQLGIVVGYDVQTSDSGTFTTTPTQTGSVTFNQINGYTYLIACRAHLVSNATDIYQATLYEDSTAGAERQGLRTDSRTSDQLRPNILNLRYRHVAASTGSKTFVVTGHRVTGTGSVWRDAGTDHPQLMTATLVST